MASWVVVAVSVVVHTLIGQKVGLIDTGLSLAAEGSMVGI